MIEWLSWLPNDSDFINFNILEILKDSSNTLPSLKFLEQRVHELVGRQRCGGAKGLDQEGLRSEATFCHEIIHLECQLNLPFHFKKILLITLKNARN